MQAARNRNPLKSRRKAKVRPKLQIKKTRKSEVRKRKRPLRKIKRKTK